MLLKNPSVLSLLFLLLLGNLSFTKAQSSENSSFAPGPIAVDFALVLDVSGSMDAATCLSCEGSRLVDMISATERLIRNIHDLSKALPKQGEQHRISITVFGTAAGGYQNAALVDIETNFAAIIKYLNGEVYQQVDRRTTSLGGGLLSAFTALANSSRPRNVIMLTDGEQRQAPYITEETNGGFSIQTNERKELLRLDQKLNVNFYAVGVGLNPKTERLLTGLSLALAPDHKAESRAPILIPIAADKNFIDLALHTQLQQSLRNLGSPQTVDYRWGTLRENTAKEDFLINENVDEVSFFLLYQQQFDSELELTIRKEGQVFSISERNPSWRYEEGTGYKRFVLRRRLGDERTTNLAGNWTMQITGRAGHSYQAYAVVDDHQTNYASGVRPNPVNVDDEMTLHVRLDKLGIPISDATVTAYIAEPGESVSDVLAKMETPEDTDFRRVNFRNSGSDIRKNRNFRYNDKGNYFEYFSRDTPATENPNRLSKLLKERNPSPLDEKIARLSLDLDFVQRLQPNERIIPLEETAPGRYEGTYQANEAGVYTVVYRIQAQTSALGGDYHRLIMSTIPVSFGEPDGGSSSVYIFPYHDPSVFYIRPVDSVGNFLGPGRDDELIVEVPADNGLAPESHVQGDMRGGYLVQISGMPTGETPNVSIRLAGHDQPFFAGSLHDVYRPLCVFANIGAAIPMGDFNEQVNTGLLAEVGSKYFLSPSFGLSAKVGYYGFNPNNHLIGITGNLNYDLLAQNSALNIVAGFGGGYYFAKEGDSSFGLNGNLCIERPLRPFLTSKLDIGFFRSNFEQLNATFLTVSLGVERSL